MQHSVNEERCLRDFAKSNSRTKFDKCAFALEILSFQALTICGNSGTIFQLAKTFGKVLFLLVKELSDFLILLMVFLREKCAMGTFV